MKLNRLQMEKEWLEHLLTETKHNVTYAAKVGGVTRAMIYNKISLFRLEEWHNDQRFALRKYNNMVRLKGR